MSRISFVLPGPSVYPIGGYKMVFEYANRLSDRGHHVNIIFNCSPGVRNHPQIPSIIKFLYCYIGVWYFPKWFILNKNVHKVCAYKDLIYTNIPDADFICATAISTVDSVMKLPRTKGKKLYFIQGFENWGKWTTEQVKETYKLGMINIVVTKWLKKIVNQSGAECFVIPNGIDFNVFNIDNPITERNKYVISMLYHNNEIKGSKYGIEALIQLKKIFPQLQVILFGIPKRPKDLPLWMRYIHNATEGQLRYIYNQSSIYLCPSIKEGFGLTGAEAMACGAAYVASDFGGLHEYVEEGRNVLLSAPKDVEGIIKNISYLFNNDEQRIQMAKNGYQDIQKLNWNLSVDKFEALMKIKKNYF